MFKNILQIFIILILAQICTQTVYSQRNKQLDSILSKINEANIEKKLNAYIELLEYYNLFLPQESIRYGEKALKIAKTHGNKKIEAKLLHLIGNAFHVNSMHNKAIEYYDYALKLRKEIEDKVGEGETLLRKASLYQFWGDFQKALELCFHSIAILENENDKKTLGRAYNFLGILYYIITDYDKAKVNSEKALKYNLALNDALVVAESHEHLSIISMYFKEYDKAEYHINKSIELRSSKNDLIGMTGSLDNFGLLYRYKKDYKKSLEYYQKAFSIKKEIKNRRRLASTINGMGIVYLAMGDNDKAIKALSEAYNIRDSVKDKRGLVSTLRNLAEAYEKKNDSKKALEFYKKYKALNDTLMNEQKLKDIAKYEADFMLDKKKKEIALLRQENTLQKYRQTYLILASIILGIAAIAVTIAYRSKRKINQKLILQNEQITAQKDELIILNKKLNEAIVTKDKFFSIIAHDLKSPYQGLLGYAQILSTEYETLTEEEKKSFIKNIEELSQNSFKLLENLLEWSRLQTGKIVFDPEYFNLLVELYPTLNMLKQTAMNKQISLVCEISTSLFVYADRNMLLTIIRNLVSNAIKFSNQNGRITIRTKAEKDLVTVSVSDNGVGMHGSVLNDLFNIVKVVSTRGTANEEGTGLGLTLCKEMINRHGGEIWVESELDKGTTFFFTLKTKN